MKVQFNSTWGSKDFFLIPTILLGKGGVCFAFLCFSVVFQWSEI